MHEIHAALFVLAYQAGTVDARLGQATNEADIVEQGQQHAQSCQLAPHRMLLAAMHRLVAIDQAGHGQGGTHRVAQVVVRSIARQQSGLPAPENILKIEKTVAQDDFVEILIAPRQDGAYRVRHRARIGHIHGARDVALIDVEQGGIQLRDAAVRLKGGVHDSIPQGIGSGVIWNRNSIRNSDRLG